MYTLCVILIVLASILMCLIVLIQNSKGGGLASGFASSNQIMGVRKTTDFLEKATWSLAAFIAVVSICASISISDTVVVDESILQQNAVETNMLNPEVAPDFSQQAPVETAPVENAN
ncbi:MAG: preprotein translocase subunit SecG [Bacteroidaceae bacterium]|nr:preprotein translocase subunit SecG [Bacteroidaceae bacterium]